MIINQGLLMILRDDYLDCTACPKLKRVNIGTFPSMYIKTLYLATAHKDVVSVQLGMGATKIVYK